MKQIHVKSILVRVIGSRLFLHLNFLILHNKFWISKSGWRLLGSKIWNNNKKPLNRRQTDQQKRPCRGGGGSHVASLNFLKHLVLVFINACHLLSAMPSLSQFGRGRLSLVAISFYVLSLLFGPCRLSEFTLAGPHRKLRENITTQ